jgi:2-keto-4-pentenoate hydratase/2-oxohepta-3-ene-1,7-dioic acid hydratase in catechol pathway
MRIARQVGGGFILGTSGGGWVSAAALGVRAVVLADLIEHLPVLAELAASATSDVHDPHLAAPVGRPGKIMAIGLNYLQHIAELGRPRPSTPMIFAKYPSAVTGPTDPIELNPSATAEVDYEAELAVVIGRPARDIDAAHAAEHILGYCVANDVSARDLQRAEPQISRSKSLDTFCPIGPWITTADEVPDPQALRITTTVNGVTRQDSTTADLLFGVPDLVAYLSRTMTLETGDVILTGTPSGVGSGMTPPTYLNEGDIVRCEIEKLGHVENRVMSPAATR